MRTRALALMTTTALASVAPLAAVAAATPAPVAAKPVVYHQKDSGRTVKASVGKAFEVRLEVCADCGDSLRLIAPNARVLRLEHTSVTSTAKPPAVGGEEFETWTFKPKNPGSAAIRVTQRSAEKGGKVTKRFALKVHVIK
jgi:hypothetical protein